MLYLEPINHYSWLYIHQLCMQERKKKTYNLTEMLSFFHVLHAHDDVWGLDSMPLLSVKWP